MIEELITTEEQYCKSLSNTLKEVKIPALEKNLLTKEESNQIFSDIDEIQNFHLFFSEKLRKSFQNFNNRESKIGDIILKVLPVFKMYFLYCDNFKNANNRLERMRKENHPFINFIKPMEFTPALQNLDLISQLVKPVQRLPKYVLLFKDLKKNTEEKHPDYKNICECLDEFAKINQENNKKVNDHLRTRKLLELDKKFGTPTKPIVKEARSFIEEEPVNILVDEMIKPVICYFFSDLILIVDESQNILLKYIELDKNTLLKDMKNTKYYKCLFSVTGKESITIISENEENKKKLFDFLDKKILYEIKDNAANRDKARESSVMSDMSMNNQKNFYFNLTVIGSMKRGIQHFRPVTMYIVQIQCRQIIHRMYFRFSELSKLNDMINLQFPNIKIDNLPKKHWWRAQKTKIIESRKLLIENFLNSIFYQNHSILAYLGLAEDDETILSEAFLQRNYEKNQIFYLDLLEKEKILGKQSVFSYLAQHTENSCFSKGSFLFLSQMKGLEDIRTIKIKLMNEESVTIPINKYTKAIEACFEIAKKLNLKSHLDFKLFLSNDEDERIIENEEYLCQVLDYDPNQTTEDLLKEMLEKEKNKGITGKIKEEIQTQINKIKRNWDDLCFCKYELVYKKYIFLPFDWEKKDLKKDQVKLNLVCSQIFSEILRSKYNLTFEEYSLIAALKSYIHYGKLNSEDVVKDADIFSKIRNYIPKLIIYLKTKNFWQETITNYWIKFSDEIDAIHQINHKYNNSTKKNYKKIENLNHIAEFCCFNFMKNVQNFGDKLFWLTSKKSPEIVNKKIDNFLWIALSNQTTHLLSPSNKKVILTMENEKISNICCFPNSFSFIYAEEEFSFYCNATNEICALLQEYMKVTQEIKKKANRFNRT